MLWSQIKLESYDVSDLHITGEFDNRPGTGRFLWIFSCMVTYRTGAGRRLYMKTSANARPGTVRCRTVPGRRCNRSAGHRTVPGRFNTNFHVQWYIHLLRAMTKPALITFSNIEAINFYFNAKLTDFAMFSNRFNIWLTYCPMYMDFKTHGYLLLHIL